MGTDRTLAGTPVEAFAYDLPEERIAQVPIEPRDAARMLVDRGPLRPPDHRGVRDLPTRLDAGDVLVVNDTRVLPARIAATKATGGAVEVLLLEREPTGSWRALVRPSRRVAPGTTVTAGALTIEVGEDLGDGVRRVTLGDEAPLDAVGRVPLPPYIHVDLDDPERYQTVYARTPGSVAAPTAGLHLTDRVLDACRERGIRIERVELQVGLGTFRPIAAEVVEDHVMHAEAYRVEPSVIAACRAARAHGSRVVAVGTTTLRTLEAVEATGELEGRTDIYLHGDVRPTLVDTLLTNFHVPRSSLLVLVDAFVGPRWRRLYETALADGYRFLSFGDCCLLDGRPGRAA
ncbi:MAG TPA: tRNA preQ1(34) S-adenosylmethionine ribosyltransferase-isomerase QueA [Iamia sp.]|jgi:S-adenosylmethionine:tRNA ribosyltransferase-isomerase|nr:tRNA preQ1(34) S-adenosylmethionine ribosyltransferase-isomerase QueA [Iamia sp.]